MRGGGERERGGIVGKGWGGGAVEMGGGGRRHRENGTWVVGRERGEGGEGGLEGEER